MGVFGGAALGLAGIFLIVYRDSSVKTDDDVTVTLNLPVLALVPLMRTTLVDRRQGRRRMLLGGATAFAVIGMLGGVAWWVVTRT
jgi:hypothetical protein